MIARPSLLSWWPRPGSALTGFALIRFAVRSLCFSQGLHTSRRLYRGRLHISPLLWWQPLKPVHRQCVQVVEAHHGHVERRGPGFLRGFAFCSGFIIPAPRAGIDGGAVHRKQGFGAAAWGVFLACLASHRRNKGNRADTSVQLSPRSR